MKTKACGECPWYSSFGCKVDLYLEIDDTEPICRVRYMFEALRDEIRRLKKIEVAQIEIDKIWDEIKIELEDREAWLRRQKKIGVNQE